MFRSSMIHRFAYILFQKSCVTGHLSLGLSDKSADRFFYGSLSPVSLQKLLEVCNINHKLPVALATIGFPEGLKVRKKTPLLSPVLYACWPLWAQAIWSVAAVLFLDWKLVHWRLPPMFYKLFLSTCR